MKEDSIKFSSKILTSMRSSTYIIKYRVESTLSSEPTQLLCAFLLINLVLNYSKSLLVSLFQHYLFVVLVGLEIVISFIFEVATCCIGFPLNYILNSTYIKTLRIHQYIKNHRDLSNRLAKYWEFYLLKNIVFYKIMWPISRTNERKRCSIQ